MEYRKERNFIVAYDIAGNMRGKWDILTNSYIGIKGNPVKSIPVAFNINKTAMPEYLFGALTLIHDWFNGENCLRHFTTELGNRLEQLISLNLIIRSEYSTVLFITTDKTPLTKDLVTYLNEENHGIYNELGIQRFNFFKNHQSFLNKCEDKKDWAIDVLSHEYEEEIPLNFIHGMILRGIHEKVFEEKSSYDFHRLIKNWYHMSKYLNYDIEVKHNILTNYIILRYLYNEDKENHYDEHLMKYNNQSWLYYENADYIVRPLLTKEDFHYEAQIQHNCVERMYMDKVAEGTTHVVAVRRKSEPDMPYITCEVTKSHRINQYLLRGNKHPSNEADNNFYTEYYNFLQSSLSE